MGIRHLILVTSGGKNLVAQYGQHDGDFNGVGKKIIKWLDGVDLNEFKSKLEKVNLVKYGSEEYNSMINSYSNMDEETLFSNFPQYDVESLSYKILNCIMSNKNESLTLVDCSNIRFTFLHHINLGLGTYQISVNTKFDSYDNTTENDLVVVFETNLIDPMSFDNISIPIGSDNIKRD